MQESKPRNTSVIELSKSAFENNWQFIQSLVKPSTLVSLVVKGNAYGHGIAAYTKMAYAHGAQHFSVFSAYEAAQVLEAVPKAQILIMGSITQSEIEWAIQNNIEFFVFNNTRLHETLEVAQKLNKAARIHIEVETGMNRTGFSKDELTDFFVVHQKNKNLLTIKGVCTHLAGAESIANHVRVMNQVVRFKKAVQRFNEQNIYPEYQHVACSAAVVNYPKFQFNMVRVGILQYGFWPSKESFIQYSIRTKALDGTDPLRRVISWKSYVMEVKEVAKGEFIGYGTTYLAQDDMKIAIVPVGYAMGFARALSNQGRVLINNQRVGVVGLVNMNLMVVNASFLTNVAVYDAVTIIGNQNNQEITVASFAELSDQLNYELLTRLPQDIPRQITQ